MVLLQSIALRPANSSIALNTESYNNFRSSEGRNAMTMECLTINDPSYSRSSEHIATPSVIDDDIKSDFDDRLDENSSGNEYIPSVNSFSSTISESSSELAINTDFGEIKFLFFVLVVYLFTN